LNDQAPQAAPKAKARAPTAPGNGLAKKPPLQSSSPLARPNLVAGINKEEEYANWQRRKGYNPRESAAKGKVNKNGKLSALSQPTNIVRMEVLINSITFFCYILFEHVFQCLRE
jgi:hypothetical protein